MKKSDVKVGMPVFYRGELYIVSRLDCKPGNVAIVEPEAATQANIREWSRPATGFRFIPGLAVPAADLTRV